uniref:Uncharacterized protein n=1 Tax=Plectus sambesii TaxID=2011161 RepID=A0A914VUY2_9BILA
MTIPIKVTTVCCLLLVVWASTSEGDVSFWPMGESDEFDKNDYEGGFEKPSGLEAGSALEMDKRDFLKISRILSDMSRERSKKLL